MLQNKPLTAAWLAVLCLMGHLAFGLSLTMQPPSIDLTGGPAGLHTFSLEVANVDPAKPVDVKISTENIHIDEHGAISFVTLQEEPDSPASWITSSASTITLKPLQKRKVAFTLRIPPQQVSGGYYVAVIAEPVLTETLPQKGINIAFRLATILRVTVQGKEPLVKKPELSDFFYVSGPVDPEKLTEKEQESYLGTIGTEFPNTPGLFLVALISNKGNIHVSGEASAVVSAADGKRINEIPLKGGTGTIYPLAGKYFVGLMKRILPKGDYVAQVRFRYSSQALVEQRPFSITVAAAAAGPGKEGQIAGQQALEAKPEVIKLEIPAGALRTSACLLTNRSDGAAALAVSVSGEASGWIEPINPNIDIAPGEQRKAAVRIQVPAGTKAGTYKGVLNIKDQNSQMARDIAIEVTVPQ